MKSDELCMSKFIMQNLNYDFFYETIFTGLFIKEHRVTD